MLPLPYHTHIAGCTPLRPSCGWKESSPCEPHRVSYAPLTAERIYHNTVRADQRPRPWCFPHSSSPSGSLGGHHGPVALALLPAAHFVLPGSPHIGGGGGSPRHNIPPRLNLGERMTTCIMHYLRWRFGEWTEITELGHAGQCKKKFIIKGWSVVAGAWMALSPQAGASMRRIISSSERDRMTSLEAI